jgi:hypothetical protein
MSIAFVRIFPQDRKGLQEITRSAEIERMAHRFIANGGRYVCEVLKTGEACFTALLPDRTGEFQDVAHGKCENGQELLDLIDELVTKSVSHLEVLH